MFRKKETPQPIEEIREEVRHLVGLSIAAVWCCSGLRTRSRGVGEAERDIVMLERVGPVPETVSCCVTDPDGRSDLQCIGTGKVISIAVRSQLSVGGDESGHLAVSAYLSEGRMITCAFQKLVYRRGTVKVDVFIAVRQFTVIAIVLHSQYQQSEIARYRNNERRRKNSPIRTWFDNPSESTFNPITLNHGQVRQIGRCQTGRETL